jgi:hypothetical protein
MTRAQRRPGKSELYFEWIECIFWLIPMGIVVLGAAIGAVAFYLSGSLFTTGCMRITGTGRHKRHRFDWEPEKSIRAGTAPETGLQFNNNAAPPTHQYPEHPPCNSPTMMKRAGKRGFFRVGASGCFPFRECKSARILAIPIFSRTTAIGRPGSGRF